MLKLGKKLVLLDVHAILHRAYHALPGFTSSRGEPTGALYGLSAFLIKIIAELKPDYLVACYDLPGPTFRKKIYDGYKAGRPKTDQELVAQIVRSRDVFHAMNVPIYEKAGFEADDIIGTIANLLVTHYSLQTIIASGDMDTLQLVSGDSVVVYTLRKGINDTIVYDEKAVKDRYGFGPELVADYKGLRGDPSDNIIGVKGIGEKTATELIKNFGSIENLYQMLEKNPEALAKSGIKPRIVELLRENEEEAAFSKMLATIRRDVPINFSLPKEDWRIGLNIDKVLEIFKELEFKTLGPRLQKIMEDPPAVGFGANFPFASERTNPTPGSRILSESADRKVGLLAHGQEGDSQTDQPLDPPIFQRPVSVNQEIKIATWLLNSDLIDPTAEDILSTFQAKELVEAEKNVPARLKEAGLEKVYYNIELPIIPIIKEAEDRGILLDVHHLEKLSKEYHHRREDLEEKIWKLAGEKFNVNSPKQLAEILFDKLKLTVKGLKKTSGGARSTRESELLKLREAHPVVESVLSYRELQKLLSTYIDPLPKRVDVTGRLHTSLNQMGTTTGRLSSSNPNLQNIPATEVRRAFVASPGYKLASFDYSQIEMRVLAWLSGDQELIKIFKNGEDIHMAVATRVFGVSESEVTKEIRRRAKVINFGVVYGMGITSLQKNLNSTREEAEKFYNNFFERFPKIKNFFEKTKNEARQKGYTTTAYGRRRYFPMINSPLSYVRAEAERMAVNAPIQGTATADIIKMAMRDVDAGLGENDLRESCHLLLQVHDELLYEIRDDKNFDKAVKLIKEAMISVDNLPVPLVINTYTGKNWGEMVPCV